MIGHSTGLIIAVTYQLMGLDKLDSNMRTLYFSKLCYCSKLVIISG